MRAFRPFQTLAVAAALAATLVPAGAQTGGEVLMRVEEAKLGTEVVKRELRGEGATFREGGRVVLFTRIAGAEAGSFVEHVWLKGEEEKARIRLEVGGPTWRTWSIKTMHPGSQGRWRVEVRDGAGRVLESLEFDCE